MVGVVTVVEVDEEVEGMEAGVMVAADIERALVELTICSMMFTPNN